MKILLASDSHGDDDLIAKLFEVYPNMDLYLHAGDSESDEDMIRPFNVVKGNCDSYYDLPKNFLYRSPYGVIYMQHDPYVDARFLKENDVKIFIHGHTHKRRFELINNIYYINPGSISYARDGHDGSYAILDVEADKVSIEFKNL